MKRPRTEIARSPYVVFYANDVRKKETCSSTFTYRLEGEAESRAEDDTEQTKPPKAEARPVRKFVEWALDNRFPNGAHGFSNNGVGNEAECNDPNRTRLVLRG